MRCIFSLDITVDTNGKSDEDIAKAISTIIVHKSQETNYCFECRPLIYNNKNAKLISLYGVLNHQDKLMTKQTINAALLLLVRYGMRILSVKEMIFNGDEQ